MIEITKRFTFEAAHHLAWHKGKCKNLHGHSYKLDVSFESCVLNQNGIVVDFDMLSQIVDEVVVKRYDHKLLNEFFPNPTAEAIAIEIYRNVAKTIKMNQDDDNLTNVKVSCVRLWETEKCSVTIRDLV